MDSRNGPRKSFLVFLKRGWGERVGEGGGLGFPQFLKGGLKSPRDPLDASFLRQSTGGFPRAQSFGTLSYTWETEPAGAVWPRKQEKSGRGLGSQLSRLCCTLQSRGKYTAALRLCTRHDSGTLPGPSGFGRC